MEFDPPFWMKVTWRTQEKSEVNEKYIEVPLGLDRFWNISEYLSYDFCVAETCFLSPQEITKSRVLRTPCSPQTVSTACYFLLCLRLEVSTSQHDFFHMLFHMFFHRRLLG